jgi:hypothetical protein
LVNWINGGATNGTRKAGAVGLGKSHGFGVRDVESMVLRDDQGSQPEGKWLFGVLRGSVKATGI